MCERERERERERECVCERERERERERDRDRENICKEDAIVSIMLAYGEAVGRGGKQAEK